LTLALALQGEPATSSARGDGAPSLPAGLLDKLVGWIALHTMYDVSATWRDPPEIVFCAVGATIDYEGRELLVDPAFRAAYDLSARRIHIVQPWSPDSLVDRSVLLHELVRDVQLRNRGRDCIGAPGWEVYRLQDLWLQEHGVILPFDWPAIRWMSECPPGEP